MTGVHYRHPAVLANMVATTDIISDGRLDAGIGSGWNEQESDAYGIELGPLRERLDRFDEACEVLISLLSNETTTFDGEYYQLREARCEPHPVQRPHPPIVIGGVGEKRILPTVARYAQQWDASAATASDEFARKLELVQERCRAIGRDPSEITTSAPHLVRPGRARDRPRGRRGAPPRRAGRRPRDRLPGAPDQPVGARAARRGARAPALGITSASGGSGQQGEPDHSEAAAMASIGSVDLKVFPNVPATGSALVQVEYTIEATLDDVPSGRGYRELVQLVKQDREIGRHGGEVLVAGGTLSDGDVVFTGSAVAYVRGPEMTLPLAALEGGISPLQTDAIRAGSR